MVILEHEFVKRSDGASLDRVILLVDTASDIPEALDLWAVGSICMVADTHSYKILNNEREWV